MILARQLATALILTTLAAPAWAFAPPAGGDHSTIELATGEKARLQRLLVPAPAAYAPWSTLVADREARWQSTWDRDTKVPARIFGRGHAVPGAINNPAIAEAAARKSLADNLALLAPGAAIGDFVLASNELDSGVRSVGFLQHHQGQRVAGGQVSFRFKKDRLFVIASDALPNVRVPATGSAIDARLARQLATAWIGESAEATAGAVKGPFILPVILASGEVVYRSVLEITVDAKHPTGRWAVALDASTGARFAKRQTLMFFNGTITMNTPERRPGGARINLPAPTMNIVAGGANIQTLADGTFTLTASGAVDVRAGAVGRLVNVINNTGPAASVSFSLQDGATYNWNAAATESVDAQVVTYIASHVVKARSKIIAPTLRYLDTQLEANVNMDDVCNAYSDGVTINFFNSGQGCENTGRLPDVIYHEFGHAVHLNAIQRGVGQFETALSEGGADYLAATVTGDQGMGRGFFFDNRALRQVDPAGVEARWPEDIDQDPHITGLIYAGAMWDLRKAFITKYGEAAAVTKIDDFWYQVFRRASDIPTSYVEVLTADDDDGDLSNGTPNLCDINAAFEAHGLATRDSVAPTLGPVVRTDFDVSVATSGSALCPGTELGNVDLVWSVRGVPGSGGRVPLGLTGMLFNGAIPQQPAGTVINYRIEGQLTNGSIVNLPDNPADPNYEVFIGEVTPLYCTDFEVDPAGDGWTHLKISGPTREGADDWQWGAPNGTEGSGDPSAAVSGSSIIGNDLGGGNFNGNYQPGVSNEMVSPMVDTMGHTNVRLQYKRWLNVEDSAYDKAQILANGAVLWSNLDSGTEAGVTHTDKEWRFHDVDLSSQVGGGSVQVRFRLTSDRGFETGGWNIDDFCIVSFDTASVPVCGNNQLEQGETCDDGNRVDGDGCEASCTETPAPVVICGDGSIGAGELCDDGNDDDTDGCTRACTPSAAAVCGDSTLAMGEQCDDGNTAIGDGCDASCATEMTPMGPGDLTTIEDGGCGCTTQGGSSSFAGMLLVFGLVLVARRR